MEKKLLLSIHDFDDLLSEHIEMRNPSDYSVKRNPPTSYPAVILFELYDGGDHADYYDWEYIYPSDFELT